MKANLSVLFLLLFFATTGLSAQRAAALEFTGYHKNVTVDLLGSNVLLGLSYDMRLQRGRMDGLGFRAGFGGFSANAISGDGFGNARVSVVTFPLEVNHIVGKRRSGFVSGAGLLPIYASGSYQSTEDNLVSEGEGFGLAGGFATLGYRFQPLRTGVTFQLNWNPMVLRGSGFVPGWVGLNVGVGFK